MLLYVNHQNIQRHSYLIDYLFITTFFFLQPCAALIDFQTHYELSCEFRLLFFQQCALVVAAIAQAYLFLYFNTRCFSLTNASISSIPHPLLHPLGLTATIDWSSSKPNFTSSLTANGSVHGQLAEMRQPAVYPCY